MLFSSGADRAKVKHLIFGALAYSTRLSAAQSFVLKYTDWFENGTIRMFVPSSAQRIQCPEPRRVHSKVYYFENRKEGRAAAVVGSANLTRRALNGEQGETAIEYEGAIDDPFFEDLRENIETTAAEACELEPDERLDALLSAISQANASATNETTLLSKDFKGVRRDAHVVLLAASIRTTDQLRRNDRIAVELDSQETVPPTKKRIHLHFVEPRLADEQFATLVPNASFGSWTGTVVASALDHEVSLREAPRTWLFDRGGNLSLTQEFPSDATRVGLENFFLAMIDKPLQTKQYRYAWKRPQYSLECNRDRIRLSGVEQLSLPIFQGFGSRVRFTRTKE